MLTATCEVATIITPFRRKKLKYKRKGVNVAGKAGLEFPPGQFGPRVHMLGPCVILSRAKTSSASSPCKGPGVRDHPWDQFFLVLQLQEQYADRSFPWALMKLPAGISGVGKMTGKTTRQAGEESCFGLKIDILINCS